MKTVILFTLLFSTITLLSCNRSNKSIVNEPTDTVNEINSDTITVNNTTEKSVNSLVGERIYGDFDGNGSFEYAYMELTKEAEGGSPIDGSGTAAEYAIKFTDKNIPAFSAGCCEIILINEGDLNNDGSDEISIFQAPMNGCSYDWRTITYVGDEWKDLLEMGLIASIGCEGVLPKEELQDIITLEDDVVYRRSVDFDNPDTFPRYTEDENGVHFDFSNLIKEKAEFKIDTSK